MGAQYKETPMSQALSSLVASGTKLWLDSIDPALVGEARVVGATGATSNPIIIADLLRSGRFDASLRELASRGLSNEEVAWAMTDRLVTEAEAVFRAVFEQTAGDDGYVSFELDPLIEDESYGFSHEARVRRYVELGLHWSKGRPNRMIKVPATPAGLDALEELAAAGVPLNVTLIFSQRQYAAARDAVWRGMQQRGDVRRSKSVYSIFVSRLDVYTETQVRSLSTAAQGQVGIVNAKQIWRENQTFWQKLGLPLKQEMVFASTGTKKPEDPPWKYVEAFAGSDIETNPPATNAAVASSGKTFSRRIDELPDAAVLAEIGEKVDMNRLETVLMADGLGKFAAPQKALLALIAQRRAT